MRAVGSFFAIAALLAACGSSEKSKDDDELNKGTPLDDNAVHETIKKKANNGDKPKTQVNKLLAVGTKAPEFSSEAHTGKVISLGELVGKKVVLYFYPKDFTGG